MGVAKAALESSVRYLAYDLGAQRVRVNAISAGPIKTAAARGIPGFADIYKAMLERAPLQRRLRRGAGGRASRSSWPPTRASAITAETIFVDNGYHAMGMWRKAEADAEVGVGTACRAQTSKTQISCSAAPPRPNPAPAPTPASAPAAPSLPPIRPSAQAA